MTTLVVGTDRDHLAALSRARVGGTDDVRFACVGEALAGSRFARILVFAPRDLGEDSLRAAAWREWMDRLETKMPPESKPAWLHSSRVADAMRRAGWKGSPTR